jgi:hypothetical protein
MGRPLTMKQVYNHVDPVPLKTIVVTRFLEMIATARLSHGRHTENQHALSSGVQPWMMANALATY